MDREFRETLAAKREKLLGPKIGKWGQLQEWMVDRDKPKDTQRHLSRLVALHPGRQRGQGHPIPHCFASTSAGQDQRQW